MQSTSMIVNDAKKAIEKILQENHRDIDLENRAGQDMQASLQELHAMLKKIESGTVEIAVYGEVSSGKSSLLNSLLGERRFKEGAKAGVTMTKEKAEWVIGTADHKVIFVDTPGLCEVDGYERELIAEDAVMFADFVIFIIDEDLKSHEFEAIKSLHTMHKPVLVAFNKIDIHTVIQRQEISASVIQKLDGIIPPENFIPVAANPMEREYQIERNDGSIISEIRTPKPIIATLKQRILEILAAEGKAIIALNASLFASDISDKINLQKIKIKDDEATNLIKKYAIVKALAVGMNPLPIVDIIGGMGTDVFMVIHLSKIYNIEITKIGTTQLLKEVGKAAGILGTVEFFQHVIVNTLKLFSAGSAIIITALPQAIIVAYLTVVYGQAVKEYFKNGCSWGKNGPKAVISKILSEDSMITKSILEEIKADILGKLGRDETVNNYGIAEKTKSFIVEKADKAASSLINKLTGIGKIPSNS